MPFSMTGYARVTKPFPQGVFTIEIQSVNRRFLDLLIYQPEELKPFENECRKLFREKLTRGRVSVHIHVDWEQYPRQLKINKAYLKELSLLWSQLKEEFEDLPSSPPIDWMTQESNLLTYEPSENENEIKNHLLEGINEAIDCLIHNKQQEAQDFIKDIHTHLHTITLHLDEIIEATKPLLEKYKALLYEKLQEFKTLPDNEERLTRELVFFADKSDINEEITRFSTHLDVFKNLINGSDAAIGKNLDFLLQELLREINTIASKAAIVNISSKVVEIKTLLEKIKEHVQNIE
jgi:uncharacterized protein (TIGR00255 family)